MDTTPEAQRAVIAVLARKILGPCTVSFPDAHTAVIEYESGRLFTATLHEDPVWAVLQFLSEYKGPR